MSDETQAPSVQTLAVAAAQQSLAVKEVNDRVDGLKKQVRVLWIVVAVVGVLALFSVFSRFFGLGFGVRPNGARFQQLNGQQFNGSGTGTGGTQTTPGQ